MFVALNSGQKIGTCCGSLKKSHVLVIETGPFCSQFWGGGREGGRELQSKSTEVDAVVGP